MSGVSVARLSVRVVWRVAILFVLVAALVACSATPGAGTKQAHVTPSPTPLAALPAFSAWRAAYVGADGRLHAVRLDGTDARAGQALPQVDLQDVPFSNASISPDGHSLAYATGKNLHVIDLTRHSFQPSGIQTVALDVPLRENIWWSPDSRRLAFWGQIQGTDGLYLLTANAEREAPFPLPGTLGVQSYRMLGWLDATHIALSLDPASPALSNAMALQVSGSARCAPCTPPDYGSDLTLGSLDTETAKIRIINAKPLHVRGYVTASVAPDGAHVLVYNRSFRSMPIVPTVELVDVQSGAVQALSAIAARTHADFTTVVWRPDCAGVAASVNVDLTETHPADGTDAPPHSHNWLLDFATDSAVELPTPAPFSDIWTGYDGAVAYVQAWSPDASALIYGTGPRGSTLLHPSAGPYDLVAIPYAASAATSAAAQVKTTPLTHDAWTYGFIGFIRTA